MSTYWVSYVSLKGLGVIVDLAQIAALVTITLRYVMILKKIIYIYIYRVNDVILEKHLQIQVHASCKVKEKKIYTTDMVKQRFILLHLEFTRPPVFDYPLYYNVLLFFFTVGLLYSVIAPLVLPFTLLYFLLATVVFKYLLM